MSSGRQNFKFKMLAVVVGLAAIVVCFYRTLSNKNYETAVVYEDTRPLSFETIGLIIRDERPINLAEKYGASATIGYTKKDGEHIRMRDRLLTIYKSESGVRVANKIADLKEQRDQLFELTQHADSIYNSSEILMRSPSDSLLKLVKNVKDMDFGKARESALKILNLINKKQLAIGKESGYAKRVADLDSKIRDLEGKEGQTVSESTNFTGCFFKSIDGYESLKASEILTRSPKPDLEQLYGTMKKQMKARRAVFGAKIVVNYDWYMVVLIDEAVTKNILKHKNNIILNFGFRDGQKVPATPIDYGAAKIPGKQFLVFRSNYMNSGLARLRMPKVSICTEKIHGLRCPASAVRFLNGEKGVFIKEGNLIKFKKIKVVYEDENIIISEPVPTDRKYLERLDEVVIRSTNLFEERAL